MGSKAGPLPLARSLFGKSAKFLVALVEGRFSRVDYVNVTLSIYVAGLL